MQGSWKMNAPLSQSSREASLPPLSFKWKHLCEALFSKSTCQTTPVASEKRKGKPSFVMHIGLLLAALSAGWCTQQNFMESPAVLCLFVPTLPLHFITLTVMLLQEIICALNLASDIKEKKKKRSLKTDYIYLHWHKWKIWGNGPLYGKEKTYWAGFTNEEVVKWNDTCLFIA